MDTYMEITYGYCTLVAMRVLNVYYIYLANRLTWVFPFNSRTELHCTGTYEIGNLYVMLKPLLTCLGRRHAYEFRAYFQHETTGLNVMICKV